MLLTFYRYTLLFFLQPFKIGAVIFTSQDRETEIRERQCVWPKAKQLETRDLGFEP